MLFSSVALGHGGGTDSLGCHHDRPRGGYHCHTGPLAGQSFSTKEEALRVLEGNDGSLPTEPGPAKPPPVAPPEPPVVPYNRNLYAGWMDADGDCQDTRQEVVIAESLVPVRLDSRGCNVASGLWLDPYTGETLQGVSSR